MRHLNVHATVITGLFEAGKSTALKQTMAGMQGVFTVQLQDQQKCKDAVFNALGITGEAMFTEVISRVTKELRSISLAESSITTSVPVVVLDIPRYSTIDIHTVSTFAKAYATDAHRGERIHVLGVMSSATAAIGFDAGGPNRRFDLFMEFSKEEAIELLKIRGITNPETAAKIVEVVGTNPGRLECAEPRPVAKAIESNKNDDEVMAAINVQYRKRIESEVQALLAIHLEGVHNSERKMFPVGREMIAALMKEASVTHACWRQKEITLASVAKKIKEEGGHAVYYHTEKQEWFWVSKLHWKEAEKQLRAVEHATQEDVIGTI